MMGYNHGHVIYMGILGITGYNSESIELYLGYTRDTTKPESSTRISFRKQTWLGEKTPAL